MIPKEYRKYSNHCGDWAGHDRQVGLSYCGWMTMHNDLHGQGATKAKPLFTIDVKYATDKGRLVHMVKGKLVHTRLRKGMKIKFDASKNHAFLPTNMANCIVDTQRWTKESKPQRDTSISDTHVRVVWVFIE